MSTELLFSSRQFLLDFGQISPALSHRLHVVFQDISQCLSSFNAIPKTRDCVISEGGERKGGYRPSELICTIYYLHFYSVQISSVLGTLFYTEYTNTKYTVDISEKSTVKNKSESSKYTTMGKKLLWYYIISTSKRKDIRLTGTYQK